jgi:hypothetical protein
MVAAEAHLEIQEQIAEMEVLVAQVVAVEE